MRQFSSLILSEWHAIKRVYFECRDRSLTTTMRSYRRMELLSQSCLDTDTNIYSLWHFLSIRTALQS